jgi:3-methyladenine DNA glycosylase AlkD
MKSAPLIRAQKELRKLACPEKAVIFSGFFKTGPGQYGEGDVFLGVTVPKARSLSRALADSSTLDDVKILLESRVHEDRFLGLCLLVVRFENAGDPETRAALVEFYLANRSGVNNWDLVDTSAYKILGRHCLDTGDVSMIRKLARSDRHWDRRIAMVSTFSLIRAGDSALTFELARLFLTDKEDLMHKATGWMLREAGKCEPRELLQFIDEHGRAMPRTMLRYSIEKFTPATRAEILRKTRR